MCISDHGFGDFARGFNANRWLIDNGYAALKPGASGGDIFSFDWTKTKAYALGINGLYINLRGREGQGIVEPGEKQALLDEIGAKLVAYRDPQNGRQVIREAYQTAKVYSGPQVAIGPDIQIGYDRAYRGSWATALGGSAKEVMEDNTAAWCSDHCVAADLVPGVVFCNRPITLEKPDLEDVLPTILAEFGLPQPASLQGASLLDRKGK
jgi:predicted AlkP superfamily phosphohydrolase/phosphomutase